LPKVPLLTIITETPARTDFNAARDHAITLIKIHDEKTGGAKERPLQELDRAAFLRVAVMILSSPSRLRSEFEAALDHKVSPATSKRDLHPPQHMLVGLDQASPRQRFTGSLEYKF
jgi:hypothetical protein